MEFQRALNLLSLAKKKSVFLFGPRSTGKTFLINKQFPKAKVYNLLDTFDYGRLARRPTLIAEEKTPGEELIVIDEIQRLPILLNEVQRLIQAGDIHFLLTGSSARKLRKGGANLLGGRAWQASLFPLCFSEIPDFDLLKYLNRGGLPHIFLSDDFREELQAYVDLYLREEIQAEALTRNLGAFARFLDVMALQNGEELYLQGISSDAQTPVRTVENYIGILEDTLIGFKLAPFAATRKRKAITRSKFFLFDVGVVNTLARRGDIRPKSELFGKCFEHWLTLELRAYLSYRRRREEMSYWRSTSGYEVDCIVGEDWAFEFKAVEMAVERHFRGLKALREEKLVKNYAVVSLDTRRRKVDGILIYPWREFVSDLWGDVLLK